MAQASQKMLRPAGALNAAGQQLAPRHRPHAPETQLLRYPALVLQPASSGLSLLASRRVSPGSGRRAVHDIKLGHPADFGECPLFGDEPPFRPVTRPPLKMHFLPFYIEFSDSSLRPVI